ncbi:MAG: T9SS type A sorting domain-containing protein [Sphingobacteriales bacterium]|nr:MAG: T9SS type A sorting domain-containing protein [Sphingobacteriales bacterium]
MFNLLWYYEIPPRQAPSQEHVTTKIIELQDSTLLFMSKDNDPVSNAFYITRLSKYGDSISTTTIQSQVCPNGNMLPYNWQFLADSSIVICGWCVSNQQAYIGRWGNLNFPLPMGFFEDTIPTDTTPVNIVLPLLQQPQVKLFPNPAKGQVRVQLLGTSAEATLQLYSVTGKMVLQRPISGAPEDIPLQGLPQGLYLYRVLLNEQVLSGKLVVIK